MPRQYLQCQAKDERLAILRSIPTHEAFLPPALTRDLCLLSLEQDEVLALIEATHSPDPLELESFLLEMAGMADQNVASFALRRWSTHTRRTLWYGVLPIIRERPLVSQRMTYTILELCPQVAGREILQRILKLDGLEEYSETFHALLFERLVQWGEWNDRVDRLAKRYLENATKDGGWPESKALLAAMMACARFEPAMIGHLDRAKTLSQSVHGLFGMITHTINEREENEAKLYQLVNDQSTDFRVWNQHWPPFWLRAKLDQAIIQAAIPVLLCGPHANPNDRDLWQLFSGISENALIPALCQLKSGAAFARATTLMQGFLPLPPDARLISAAITWQRQEDDGFAHKLPARLALALTHSKLRGLVEDAETKALNEQLQMIRYQPSQDLPQEPKDKARDAFFDLAFRGDSHAARNLSESATGHVWGVLIKNWKNPQPNELPSLKVAAHTLPAMFRECYIATLGRFVGDPKATLTLVEMALAADERDVPAIITALAHVATERGYQELVAMLTRPVVRQPSRLAIVRTINQSGRFEFTEDLRNSLTELKKTVSRTELLELLDELSHSANKLSETFSPPEREVEVRMQKRIPTFDHLSLPAKRALRTAEFIHEKIMKNPQSDSRIELSPIIEMQYKSLEITFRETFDPTISHLINNGLLQRKLDVLGYARPVWKQIDAFEEYLAALDDIRNIPFFSHHKLRKMLLALCKFRPGRRFGMDSIKAFGLFFLAFSRKQCPFGLANVLPLGFATDRDLLAFCRMLHEFQDFRNRAAHEGIIFSPQVGDLWTRVSEIYRTLALLSNQLK